MQQTVSTGWLSRILIWIANQIFKLGLTKADFTDFPKFRIALEKLADSDPLPVGGVQSQPFLLNGLQAEWIVPNDAPTDAVLLYLHGGGYCAGSIHSHRKWVSYLCKLTQVRALMINYRLAPEAPFPAAVEDGFSAYEWLINQGFRESKIAVAGDSAGGGLSAALIHMLHDYQLPLPQCVYLCCPFLDVNGDAESWNENAHYDHMLPRNSLVPWRNAYIKDADPCHPYASPLFGPLHYFPPTFIQCGSREVLRDDAIRFYEKAKREHVQVELQIWHNMTHVWQCLWRFLPAGKKANKEAALFLRRNLF